MRVMDDLAAWLTQILDEEQRAAEECAEVYPPPWELSDRGHTARIRADEPNFWIVAELEQHPTVDGWLGDRLEHIVRHDPAAVLARIAADRLLLKLHSQREDGRGCYNCDTVDEPCRIHAILALPHADRPGYREEWKP